MRDVFRVQHAAQDHNRANQIQKKRLKLSSSEFPGAEGIRFASITYSRCPLYGGSVVALKDNLPAVPAAFFQQVAHG